MALAMIYTTLNKIREAKPCRSGWKKLLESLNKKTADDEPLPLAHIVNSNGILDALWCTRTLPEYDKEWRLFAVWCARRVEHLLKDERSHKAIEVAEKFALGDATEEELEVASGAARAACWAASDASDAYWAARTASEAAYWAASGASDDAYWAARAASGAAYLAACAASEAARAAEREAQTQRFLEIVS